MIEKIDKIFKKNKLYNYKYIYIYSDLTLLLKLTTQNPSKTIIQFLNLFIKKGITCIIPSFSYTTKNKFIIQETKSKVGFLGNFVLKNLTHSRSEHPLFSYIAIGKNKKIVKKIGKSAFGKDSLHERLFQNNSCFLNFCKPLYTGNTLVHHIEQNNEISYRFEKRFSTKIYNKDKYLGTNYSAYLRKNVKNVKTSFTFKKTMKHLKNKKYIKISEFENLKIEIYDYDLFYKDLTNLIKKNKKIFIKN